MPTEYDLRQLVDELWLCFQQSAEYHRSCTEAEQVLSCAAKVTAALRRRLMARSKRYVVAFVGSTNVGKSTLLNKLFGCELAPKRNGPCTAVPIEFEYGEPLEVRIDHRDGDFRPERIPCASTEAVAERLRTLADDGGADAAQQYAKITVRAAIPLLQNVIIADTPGFGAAQAEGAEGVHERALVEYLQSVPGRVIWLTQAVGGFGKRELEFYRRHLEELCDDVVITMCAAEGEAWTENDAARHQRRYGRAFGRRRPTFHFVSAAEGMGIDALRRHLAVTADPKHWMADFVAQLRQLTIDVADWFVVKGDRLVRARLRPDAVLRFAAGSACGEFRDELLKCLNALKSKA